MSDKKYLLEFYWQQTKLFKGGHCFREWDWIPQIGMNLVLRNDEGFDTNPEYWKDHYNEDIMPVTMLSGEVANIEFQEARPDYEERNLFRVKLKPEE